MQKYKEPESFIKVTVHALNQMQFNDKHSEDITRFLLPLLTLVSVVEAKLEDMTSGLFKKGTLHTQQETILLEIVLNM